MGDDECREGSVPTSGSCTGAVDNLGLRSRDVPAV